MAELFPSPFDALDPEPAAQEAALRLQARLRTGWISRDVPTAVLESEEGGKMFGVLVARDDQGRHVELHAFSGMLLGRWHVEGFVPPVFDEAVRTALEPAGEAVVKALWQRRSAEAASPQRARVLEAHAAMRARHRMEQERLKEEHRQRRQLRQRRREQHLDFAELEALAQESRGDKATMRRLLEEHAAHALGVNADLARAERKLSALDRLRTLVSRELMKRLHDTYRIQGFDGEQVLLRSLYPNGEPPSGAGDCAAPKLLAFAQRQKLTPVAMAEFWWGRPPRTGGRVAGRFYPACKDKCGPLLPAMLRGLPVRQVRSHQPGSRVEQGLDIVYEDEWLIVLEKPAGLLSIPGRGPALRDSVQERLRARYGSAWLAHRLDLETSGLLVAARDELTYRALQRQFTQQEVAKRYIAWVLGELRAEEGTILLPLRVDVLDRPRQIVDPAHGKAAITTWEVAERRNGRTRVRFFPRTGRTHQLRVHAAHPDGLGAPIVGDALYGHPDDRLMLHAESLNFLHPRLNERISFERPAPF